MSKWPSHLNSPSPCFGSVISVVQPLWMLLHSGQGVALCQGMVRRSGAGSMGYGLGVPERAGSPAMGAPREEPSGSVCSGSDTHNSVFFRGVLPQGGLAWLRETVPCRYAVVVIWKLTKFVDTTYLAGTQLRRRLSFSIACKVTIYMWQQTT